LATRHTIPEVVGYVAKHSKIFVKMAMFKKISLMLTKQQNASEV